MEQVTLPAGTIVKVNGLPFRLPQDTVVEGRAENLEAATRPLPGVEGGEI